MTGKKFFLSILILTIASLGLLALMVWFVDPFFHYRAPKEKFWYRLYDQRSQNDGITRNFEYDAIITGTSMAENFRASVFDEGLGVNCIKVAYSGATYKEINDNLEVAYKSGHSPRYVLRPLDYSLLSRDKDEMRTDMGEYPVWLTNDNPFDDVKYLLNREVIVNYTIPVILKYLRGEEGGHTSFDEYSYTADTDVYNRAVVLGARTGFEKAGELTAPTDEDMERTAGNIEQNVVELARKHSETTFLYFFPPYSMAYWGEALETGEITAVLDYKKAAIEQMLECENIHIYSFTGHTEITADLNRYRDVAHYDGEVNDLVMTMITDIERAGAFAEHSVDALLSDRITKDNAGDYLDAERELLMGYDYNSLLK